MPPAEKRDYGEFVVVARTQKKENDNKKLTIITEPETVEPIEGRDEMNLIELPFSLVSYRNTNKLKTIESRWPGKDEKGNPKEFYKIVTGSDWWGLPTFQAEEVLIAALELTYRQNFESRKVRTTKYELLSLMNWPRAGGHYRRLLTDTFAQLRGVTIATNHFWDNGKKRFAEVVFGIIDDVRFYDDEQKRRRQDNGQLLLPLGYFNWNETFWNSMQAGYIKRLDTATYFSLKSNLTRRFYRYADKHLHNGGVEIDLFRLALDKLVMVGNYKYPSEVIRKIQPAIDELNRRKLAKIKVIESKTASGYKVSVQPVKRLQNNAKVQGGEADQEADVRPAETGLSVNPEPSAAYQNLSAKLVGYGVTRRTAEKLVRKDLGQVARHLEVFEWITQNQPERIIDNKAGFLVKMIRENWSAPEGFISKEEEEDECLRSARVQQELAAEYREALQKLEQDLDDFFALPPEQQIAAKLDFWEQDFRRRHRSNPTEEERTKRKARYLQEIPSREQQFETQLKDLHQQFEQQAAEQGLVFNPD